MHVSVVSVAGHYYLAFNDGETTSLLCDAATGNGLRCTSQGSLHIKAGHDCSQPLSFQDTEAVEYPNKLNATISYAFCTLDGDMMEMTMRLEFGDYVASNRERLVLVDGTGSYLIPEWEVHEQ